MAFATGRTNVARVHNVLLRGTDHRRLPTDLANASGLILTQPRSPAQGRAARWTSRPAEARSVSCCPNRAVPAQRREVAFASG
jgi:hypothetical protein